MTKIELIEEWYEKEENIFSLHKDKFGGELILGFSQYGTVDISYIFSLGANFNISVDKRMELAEANCDDEVLYGVSDLEKFLNELLVGILSAALMRECVVRTSPREIESAIMKAKESIRNVGEYRQPYYNVSIQDIKSFLSKALRIQ